jgi:hypothetical protein
VSGSETGAALAHHGPPHGIDLIAHATISAEIAEGDRPLADILRERGLTDEQWTEATLFWTQRMAEDARGGEPRVALAFSDAFARAQDARRPLVQMSVEEWAALVTAAEQSGVAVAVAARGLRMADYFRLVRHWAKALASGAGDGAPLARAYEAARGRLGTAGEGV